jgi:hypothetical protein
MEPNTITEQLQNKWQPILEHADLPEIKDTYRKQVTSILLENQEKYLKEAAPANATVAGGNYPMNNWDPILISLVRRAMPNLIAYDICGVQPMSGPTGLIFALRSRYQGQKGDEALFQEASTKFAGDGSTAYNNWNTNNAQNDSFSTSTDPVSTKARGTTASGFDGDPLLPTGAWSTQNGEALGGVDGDRFPEMAFSIEKTSVTAKTRALKAEYTMELAQDLKAIHGLDAETELANILSAEILAEINREVVRSIYSTAKLGCRTGTVQTPGIFDLNVDANGRWSVEKYKGLMYQIEREANFIAKDTRRGKGNFILCSSDVASALAMAGVLDYTPALSTNLNVDDTGNTFAGVLNGKTKVYVDPYFSQSTAYDFCMVGYRGTSPYDAGMFYCPYVPLQMVRAVGEQTFQPKIAFKTRYGIVNNPFVSTVTAGGTTITDRSDPVSGAGLRSNPYYRIFRVDNLL